MCIAEEPCHDVPGLHRDSSESRVGTDAMTLIAEKEGQEVAKIHGPHRTEFVLEYHNPQTGNLVRMSRSNLHVLRTIAEQVFPELIWKE